MRTLLALFLAVTVPLCSQTTPRASGDSPAATHSPAELQALERFLSLSDAELAQMADAIARVRAMTPGQRAALSKEIAAFRALPQPQREQLRQGWGWMPPEIRAGWHEMMQNATPERRATIQAKLQSLGPAEKAAYRRSLVEQYLKEKKAQEP